MCPDSLVLRENPSAFGVLDPCKYFEKFILFINVWIRIFIFWPATVKYCRYKCSISWLQAKNKILIQTFIKSIVLSIFAH